ncbi:arginine kinase-like [Dendronephthya gigantea]|uniref:arginine kinase-like n=1 Tax=Dendronephthya gigantea TaxID=151771 RepID=UPI00106DB07C|nr:arginine kinase-like [Dendronephthya gigantea]
MLRVYILCSSIHSANMSGKDVKCGSHLKSIDELTGYPLFPTGTKSLMARFNTREIWKKYHDKKDAYGLPYKLCVFSGIKNLDSGVGVYASSHDSYRTFSELMDQVIEAYHKHKPGDKHISDMDANKLKCPLLPPDEAKMIVSTRIRVSRNLEGYPLAPGVTKEQRDEIMGKVVRACDTFTGDLKGAFYPLEEMAEKTRKKLIADHFLFKEGDRFLEACGCNRDWPSGRGIFYNAKKTFLVWVNEEDQLRIISMQQGSDFSAVFKRLSRAINHIESVATFSYDDHLGYITSCPTNLGTALRASVHIKLPKLSARKDEFQAIADKFHVQIRGTHGEHSKNEGGIYDISNKRRLGRTEVQLVQDMYNGVKAMIAREKEL